MSRIPAPRKSAIKDLSRFGFAINRNGAIEGPTAKFDFDARYEGRRATLLHTAGGRGRKECVSYSSAEIQGIEEKYREIVGSFKKALPSRSFKHLIILRLHVGHDQVGAIRIINSLESTKDHCISRGDRFPDEARATATAVGAMLAIAFESYQKTEMISAFGRNIGGRQGSEAEAIEACLNSLVDERVGFPLAAWREYSADGAASVRFVKEHKSQTRIQPPASSRSSSASRNEQGRSLRSASAGPVDLLKSTNRAEVSWAKEHGLSSVYRRFFSLPRARRRWLEIYAHAIDDFDQLSRTLIETQATILERTLKEVPATPPARTQIMGVSSAFRKAYARAARSGRGIAPVLIQCETGAGKESLARHVHDNSPRKLMPFVAVNCSALNDSLQDSQLFGHEIGAFTGADRVHKGYFEQAHGGTLFLDEIGDIPLHQQGRLLRALEVKQITRLGGTELIDADARIVVATNKVLK